MAITERPNGAPINPELHAKLKRVSYPTIGHFHERGFVESGIKSHLPGSKILGRAVTVHIPGLDSSLMHRAVALMEPGDVLVVATGGDRRHAPVGEVVAHAVKVAGGSAIVIDGVMTDVNEVARIGLPVFARGSSVLTTKLLGVNQGGVNVPVSIGGVAVCAGDIILADDNGVLALAPEDAESLIDQALDSDANEHVLISKLDNGTPLPDVTIANRVLAQHLKPAADHVH
ncbi:RraA family protein [Arthrobacter sp. StoSoilB5]|uniref:RraA family protein n=1 Tax=Arthrobacter sp. StoSoilB5 TaxID=2830992 RepID=UPI001CC5F416|nr:RraA family protein [Arthrobacter sp. StoSoilB5]BCW44892.1 4-hydroxy-4-methyl-2-oxoglutarate aldolase [Arthrobacter sp. StoSoilB5]